MANLSKNQDRAVIVTLTHRRASLHLVFYLLTTSILGSTFGNGPPYTDVAFSPDGGQLVAVGQNGLEVFDSRDLDRMPNKLIESKRDLLPDNLHCVAFSPDGKYLAVGGGNPAQSGSVTILEWPALEKIASLVGHQDSVCDIAWIGSRQLASASFDRYVRIWNVDRRGDSDSITASQELLGHSSCVSSVSWDSSTHTLISAGEDKTLRVWELGAEQPRRSLSQHTGPIHSLALRPASEDELTMIASAAGDRTIRFWQPTIGRMVRYFRLADTSAFATAWIDGSTLAVGCQDGTVRFVDSLSVTVTSVADQRLPGPVFAVAVHPKHASLVAAGSGATLVQIPLPSANKTEVDSSAK